MAMADPETALILLTENWSEARPDSMDEASGALVVEIPKPRPREAIAGAGSAHRAGFGSS